MTTEPHGTVMTVTMHRVEEAATNQVPGDKLTSVQTCTNTVTESSNTLEHEEGEIDDEEEDRNGLEYEDISSDEEFTIRERIAQLEAMDSELGRLTVKHNASFKSSTAVDDEAKENYECVSDDEDIEMYLNRFEPVPKPKLLPPRRRTTSKMLRPSRRRTGTRRNVGSSSSARRHTEKSARHKEQQDRSRHSHSGLRKVSSMSSVIHRRHKRRKTHASNSVPVVNIGISSSDTSETEFPLDRARLQAACNISSNRKRKTDKENWDALKRKLKGQIQKRRKEQAVKHIVNEPVVLDVDEYGEAEEEEDEEVLQLRLQALKTKAELKEPDVISLLEDPISPNKIAEEQELRLLALRSTFTKKHQMRLKKRQEERPYSPSDDIPLLLSPTSDFPTPPEPEITNIDDDIQIIEIRPETVEISDSSSSDDDSNRMEISPTESLQCPESLEEQSRDPVPENVEYSKSEELDAPVPTVDEDQPAMIEDTSIPEPPPPPIIGNLHKTTADEEDEELLRNQLLSNLKPTAVISESRPMTPDSMAEEEAEALRALILSKMNKKASVRNREQTQTPPQASDMSNQFHSGTCQSSPALIVPSPVDMASTTANPIVTASNTNPPRLSTNPNLITLIDKRKIARKKRKKSETALQNRAAKKAALALNAPLIAIAAPPPARTLIKAPVVQQPPLPPLSVALPATATTKLVNNPNKLININTPLVISTLSPRERSAPVETFFQKPVRKLIIQVGNSDSDSDPDYYPPADDSIQEEPQEVNRLRESFLRDLDNASPSRVMLESPTYSPVAPTVSSGGVEDEGLENEPLTSETTPAQKNPEADSNQVPFEQRLDHFLRSVRSKIDQSQATLNGAATDRPAQRSTSANVTPSTVGSGPHGLGAASKPVKQAVSAPVPVTPLAVRHLPKSAQLEYKRLVARMAQLEKQKQIRINAFNQRDAHRTATLTKTIINSGAMDAGGAEKNHELVVTINRDGRDVQDKTNQVPVPAKNQPLTKRDSDTLFKRVLINNTVIAESSRSNTQPTVENQNTSTEETKEQSSVASTSPPIDESNDSIPTKNVPTSPKRKVGSVQTDHEISSLREELHRLSTANGNKQKVLAIAEYRFAKHSQRFHKELRDLIATVENAQHERQKQYDLENKVAFLKEKLTVLERALALHKGRIELIFPALQQSHTNVMNSRKKSIELNNLCLEIGRAVKGPDYNAPSVVNNEIHDQLKVLTLETKKLKNMKKLSLDEFKQMTAEQRQTQAMQRRQLTEADRSHESAAEVKDQPAEANATSKEVKVVVTKDQEDSRSVANKEKPKQNNNETSGPGSMHSTSERPTQEAQTTVACESQTRFGKYTSPLASFKDQSALNIPDGVICPYQMRGECVDQDCKFEHFQ
ncbi:uncharacterized protein LOC129722293 [Wyeomyia smithii]|uniref:uncharacterized protein LOC129722293 n=1 Tax=Wyeomyia smithii TaxID=174621 RepID=UPI002467C6BA|nr:uncharacterized protein LOC129722293 [Wyeomyia smithii]